MSLRGNFVPFRGKCYKLVANYIIMERWGYGDKEKIFCIRKLQLKNRFAIPNALFSELGKPKEISFVRYPLSDNSKTVIAMINSDAKVDDDDVIVTSTVEPDASCGRLRIVIPKQVIEELNFKNGDNERIAVIKTNRNGIKTIEIVCLNINLIRGE